MSEQSFKTQNATEQLEEVKSQDIRFGAYNINYKYGNGSIPIESTPLLFKDCFTFGFNESKFDDSYSLALCLESKQLEMFNSIVEECVRHTKDNVSSLHDFKTCLYGNKVYVKADSTYCRTYSNDKCMDFDETKLKKNFKADMRVQVKGIFIDSKKKSYLQLRLIRLDYYGKEREDPMRTTRLLSNK